MVESIREVAADWKCDVVSIAYPRAVGHHGPRSEPGNLGPGWVGFDVAAAFECPVRIINDAAMQALGSYEGGRMLFLGLGTGLGSTMIADNVIVPLELGKVFCARIVAWVNCSAATWSARVKRDVPDRWRLV